MASKITSASEVNTGFLSSVSIPNSRQGLLEHFFESSPESEDDFSDSDVCSSIFSDKFNRENSLRNSTVLKTIYTENVSQRSDMGIQRTKNKDDSKKGETIFLPKYDCRRHFDLSMMLCCKLHVTFTLYKFTYAV